MGESTVTVWKKMCYTQTKGRYLFKFSAKKTTTDTQAINQTIYDFKNDFNLGSLTFIPFLSSPNTQAPTSPTSTPEPSTTPSPSVSDSPIPSPTVPELSWLVILPLLLSVFFLALALRHRKTANLKQ
jgi:hypothetical protein